MNRPVFALGMILGLCALAPADAASRTPPFTVVETGKTYWRLDDAVWGAGDRTATIRVAPGVYPECAVLEEGYITIVAEQPGTAIFDGGICDGKATLVAAGRGLVVDGLVFRNLENDDGNGAAIRAQDGPVTVRNCMFLDSQEGILSGSDPEAAVIVDRSTFSGVGYCGDDCAHGIYMGDYKSLTVTNSRFERGTGGHYIKSRTPHVTITDNSFDDSKGQKTNYMIDLPNGATGSILRNTFVVGANKENRTALIAVSAEERENDTAGLVIADNKATLATGVPFTTTFVADWSHQPLAIGANDLGPGIARFKVK